MPAYHHGVEVEALVDAGAIPKFWRVGRKWDVDLEDLERVKQLLDELENPQEIARLLDAARDAEGCRIFIGSENRMFALSGSSVIAAPYRGSRGEVVGVVGVIGPTRLNYARVVPMVDFTAQALTRLMT